MTPGFARTCTTSNLSPFRRLHTQHVDLPTTKIVSPVLLGIQAIIACLVMQSRRVVTVCRAAACGLVGAQLHLHTSAVPHPPLSVAESVVVAAQLILQENHKHTPSSGAGGGGRGVASSKRKGGSCRANVEKKTLHGQAEAPSQVDKRRRKC